MVPPPLSLACGNGLLVWKGAIWSADMFLLFLQDNQIKEILEKGSQTITLTIIPTFIFEHMIKWYVQVILSLL